MNRSIEVAPCLRIEGETWVPGDKSISHRALFVAGLAEGTSSIAGLGPAADVDATRRAMSLLGGSFSESHLEVESPGTSRSYRDTQIVATGPGWSRLSSPARAIDVGNSGTTIRLLAGILAGSPVSAVVTGDGSIRRRPMARVVEPLRAMGAQIEGEDGGARAPLRITGSTLHGHDHDLPIASAQIKSALLFAGLRASGVTSVREPAPSRDHTERMLRYVGVPVEESKDRLIVSATDLHSATFTIPGDLSSAAFLLVTAAILPGSRVTVRDVGVNPTRAGILEVLREFGAEVVVEGVRDECGEPVGDVTVTAADRRPVEVTGARAVATIDELPLVAVLGAAAEGETVVADAAELRVKESDRIAALVEALGAMGVAIRGTPDGFVVTGRGGRYAGAVVDPRGDHRIAMAAAVAGLAATEGATRITDAACVAVSWPAFERDLGRLVVR